MKRLIQCGYNVQQIVNKLYRTLPLVPIGTLTQDIAQDIQMGLYKDCGDPNEHWDLWMERAKEILRDRNIIDVMEREQINAMPYMDNSYGKISTANNKLYTWQEVCDITNNAGGKIYSSPYGDYNNYQFELKLVDTNLIDKDSYLTLDECREYDLDEDESVIENLIELYDSGENFPPIILDSNYKIIDGSHRMGVYDWIGLGKIKAYVKKEK